MRPSKRPSGYGLPFSLKEPAKVRQIVAAGSQPVPFCGCWLWLGSLRNRHGYGGVNVGGRILLAHRAAYAAFNGDILAKSVVMHTCDTPLCVNPEHLRLGTVHANMRDMYDKGRKSKLGRSDVVTIRELLKTKSRKEVAEMFAVNLSTIANIATGARWSRVV